MSDTDDRDAYSRSLDLAHLISGPLTALVEADAMASETFLRFLREVAFEPPETPDPADPHRLGKLRYVSFTYEHMRNGKPTTSLIRVPLISLLPLPALQVEEATFDFALDMFSARYPEQVPALTDAEAAAADTRDRPLFAPQGLGGQKPRMLASLSRDSGSRPAAESYERMSTRVNVHVTMRAADMPGGLGQILNIATSATSGRDVGSPGAGDDDDTDAGPAAQPTLPGDMT